MDDKPRLNPFSISNILSNNTKSRSTENRELTKAIETDRTSKCVIDLNEGLTNDRQCPSYPNEKDEKKASDFYDWEDDSSDHSPEKGDFDGKL